MKGFIDQERPCVLVSSLAVGGYYHRDRQIGRWPQAASNDIRSLESLKSSVDKRDILSKKETGSAQPIGSSLNCQAESDQYTEIGVPAPPDTDPEVVDGLWAYIKEILGLISRGSNVSLRQSTSISDREAEKESGLDSDLVSTVLSATHKNTSP